MKFSYLRQALVTSIIVIMAGCQSGQKGQNVSQGPAPGSTPIVTQHLPAKASEEFLPGAQQPTTKIALLLPLSGQQSSLGNAMLNAAQMSLFENAPDHIELVCEDTRGTPEGATKAAQKVIQDGARVIMGPIFANEASAVVKIASLNQVPVLSFSNNRSVANQNLFILGFMPDQQINRLFSVAQSKGIQKIALLIPSNEAGNQLRSAAENAARANGIQLTILDTYAPGSSDMKKQAQGIKQSAVQAVVIPEGGQHLRLIISSLLSNNIDPNTVKFLGTGQWDSPDIYNDKSLSGSWFVASPISLRQKFTNKYSSSYNAQAPRLATLAYDCVSMISLLMRNKDASQAFLMGNMTQVRGYQGLDGIFRLNTDGTVERGLAVYEINEATGLEVISPAPEAF